MNTKPQYRTGPLMAGTLKLGQIVKGCDGYRFLPATSVHKPSRKEWPTPDACIPAWARRMLMEWKRGERRAARAEARVEAEERRDGDGRRG